MTAVAWAGPSSTADVKKPMRDKPEYRVLYNQDATDLFDKGGNLTPKDVHRMVDEVADGGADVFLVNPNCQRVNYPSKVWQNYWDGYKEGDPSWFGDIPEKWVDRREHWIREMAQLARQCDYLATALARCREKGIAPGITLRMNDMHDAPWRDSSHLFSNFYRENPQLHLKPHDGRSWGGGGLDYAHVEVREHYLALIRELAEGYDFDVLELDFLRFSFYFDRDEIDRHCEMMTGFIQEVRAILDGTGRPIALMPRIASSPGAARQLGFDVRSWSRLEIVDGITVSNMLCTSWDLPIEAFRSLVGPNVAVYVGTEVQGDYRDGLPVRYLPESYEMLRGLAASYLAIGADGFNMFNFFLARHHHPVTAEAFYGGLREIRSLEASRNKPRIHVLSAGAYQTVESDMPEQVPTTIRTHKARRFEMLLAAESAGQKVDVLVCFYGECEANDLWLRIGLHSVGHAVEIREGSERKKDDNASKSKIAVFNVPAGIIKDGRNELIIRSQRVNTTVLGIDVCIR